MACKFIITLAVAALAKAAIVPVAPAVPVIPTRLEEYDAAPQYSFAYDVQDALTGDSKAQYETRNGDIVQGSYSFIEADGTRRIVDYTADPINGFNAIVSREPALAAIATAPLGIAPVASVAPAAPIAPAGGPLPAIPVSGPDSDVEVLDARSGPIREIPGRRINEYSGQLNRQSPAITERRENQRAVPIRAIASRLSVAPSAPASKIFSTEDMPSARYATPVAAPAPAPVVASANVAHPPYTAYTAAYSSPLAFNAPISGLTYTPVNY